MCIFAAILQTLETSCKASHLPYKEGVAGSNQASPTSKLPGNSSILRTRREGWEALPGPFAATCSSFVVAQSVGDGLLEGHCTALCPCSRERIFPQCRAGGVHSMGVICLSDRREGSAHLLAQRGGRPQEPRRPLRLALH